MAHVCTAVLHLGYRHAAVSWCPPPASIWPLLVRRHSGHAAAHVAWPLMKEFQAADKGTMIRAAQEGRGPSERAIKDGATCWRP